MDCFSGAIWAFYQFAVIMGPVIVGTIVLLAKNAGVPSTLSSRIGISSVSLLFIAGGVLLIVAEWLRREKGEK